MTPQIPKPQDEKEAIATLTYAVQCLNETLVNIDERLKTLNVHLLKREQTR
jgi:hypothetical protein